MALLLGFLFILIRTSRFFTLQTFKHTFAEAAQPSKSEQGLLQRLLISFMDTQSSLFGMLLFLLSPALAFGFFLTQALVLALAYVRYFLRAIPTDEAGGAGTN